MLKECASDEKINNNNFNYNSIEINSNIEIKFVLEKKIKLVTNLLLILEKISRLSCAILIATVLVSINILN